jgi:hypothetical protein
MPHCGVVVELLGYVFGVVLAVVLLVYAWWERRWWNWLQVAGIAVLTVAAVAGDALPEDAEALARLTGPPLLVTGLLAWRLHWDAGWFGGDDLRPPGGVPDSVDAPEPDNESTTEDRPA